MKASIFVIGITCGFMIIMAKARFRNTPTQPLVWYPTRYKVDEGTINVVATYTHKSPCDTIIATFNISDSIINEQFNPSPEEESTLSLKQLAVERLYLNCNAAYNEVWLPVWMSANNRSLIRTKRFIDPVSIGITVFSAITIASAAVTANTAFVTVPKMQAEIDSGKDFMRQNLNVNSILEKLETKTIAQLKKENEDLQSAVLSGVDISWTAVSAYSRIVREADQLKEVILSEKRHDKVPLKVLGQLLREQWLEDFEEGFTSWHHLKRINTSTIEMGFTVKKTSTEVEVLKAMPFKVYTNITRTSALVLTYGGPSYCIFNKTNHCLTAIDPPGDGLIQAECTTANYTSPSFKL